MADSLARLIHLREYIDETYPNAAACLDDDSDPNDTVNLVIGLLHEQNQAIGKGMDREYEREHELELQIAELKEELSKIKAKSKSKVAKQNQMQSLRERSGSVNCKNRLVEFLYILMRDHLPAGVVEGILQKHVSGCSGDGDTVENLYTNGYLANYATDVAERLQTKDLT
jgi:altronate dehydratase